MFPASVAEYVTEESLKKYEHIRKVAWHINYRQDAEIKLLNLLWPSITEWEMYITAQGPRLRNDLYCVEWDVKL